jgi:hypothetical protein
MIIISGETPPDDLGVTPYAVVDAAAVTEHVIWPLVNAQWGQDWLAKSLDGFELVFPRSGIYQGKEVEVELVADCKAEEGEESLLRSVSLSVETVETGFGRELVLKTAKQAVERWGNDEDSEEDDESVDELEWPEGDERTFKVESGARYGFDTSREWVKGFYSRIIGGSHTIEVPATVSEVEGLSEDRLLLTDLGNIRAACFVFDAPASIMKAVDFIRDNARINY